MILNGQKVEWQVMGIPFSGIIHDSELIATTSFDAITQFGFNSSRNDTPHNHSVKEEV